MASQMRMPEEHIRLYAHEIKDMLSFQVARGFGIFNETCLGNLEEMFQDEERASDARKYVFRWIMERDRDNIWKLEKLLEKNPTLFKEYLMEEWVDPNGRVYPYEELSRNLFIEKFYCRPDEGKWVVECLCDFIMPDELAMDLRKHFGQAYAPVVEEAMTLVAEKHDLNHLACKMIRRMPQNLTTCVTGDWYCHFLIVLRENPYHAYLAEAIDPDNAGTIDVFRAEQRAKEIKADAGLENEDDIYKTSEEDLIFRPKDKFEKYMPKFEIAIPPPIDIALRSYQEELVEIAVTGKNTIICAPTGAGKTVVASYIMLDHLNKMKVAGKPARVAMMVPTIPLVEQQCTALLVYFRLNYTVNGFCGTETADFRAYTALACDVALFTPQLFLNMLKSPKKTDRLNVADFTMFVFDECHHCDGEHPYKLLMEMVQETQGPQPQIIGLTASVGVGSGSNSIENCMQHMLKICVHLSAEAVSTVRRSKDDLNKHVVPPLDIIERASRLTESRFIKDIHKNMKALQEELEKEVKRFHMNKQLQGRLFDYQFPTDKNSFSYQNFLGTLGARITAVPGLPHKTKFLKALEILKQYQLALEYNDLLPMRYAQKFLLRACDEMKRTETEETYGVVREFRLKCNDLCTYPDEGCERKKDILVRLNKLITEQYSTLPESRTLIFVQKRAFAEMLCDYMNELCKKIPYFTSERNAGYITSANQSSALGGQTGYLQRQTIENFNHGVLRILVATSVAEEGLDISTCNLIIKYNNTGSEKTLIQRRGRARAKGSKSVLLALDGSIEANEMAAVQKEDLMKRCMEHLQSYGASVLSRMIHTKRCEMKEEAERILEQRRQTDEQIKSNKYQLVCIKCGTEICDSTQIRKLPKQQYACFDRDIWTRVNIKPREMPKSLHGSMDVAQMCCKNGACDQIFGMVWLYSDTLLPVFKVTAFIMYDYEKYRNHTGIAEEPIRVKRWMDVARNHFVIRDAREVDLKDMYGALRAKNISLHNHLLKNAEHARIVLARKEIEKRRFGGRRGRPQRENLGNANELAEVDEAMERAQVHDMSDDNDGDYGICG
ncbi:hypothetical protein L596_015527 [Steinernema carpocapsae]|uniref:RNA helicase n=1 Tax=Steinernema carpocapsae TaxID=34508 RepID=A0A4U5NG45_STECR|nr:hypothetical protein L596_015527 [Steinernema carpocapsae]